MKVKIFTIRLTENELEIDQNSLNDFLEMVSFKKSDTHFIELENKSYWSVLVHYEDLIETKSEETKTIEVKQESDLSEREQLIYQNLKQWRNEKAIELNLPHYMICHNSELLNVSLQKPENNSQLRKIKGFGEVKSDKYGDAIIALLKAV
ncbi:HRDC domain-containing protein [Flavobacterium sp. SUN052]|uniref:HRDC domain-containing protein n=1 Tax=Flavobacterium sp. SUN052 TaxID=3002441 RepID=UPI00237E010B|nr:HRDC domain-containing protein [Flavobacterium sp. SUN052]MEC4003378.1 HRDC domain-containing protein [Flavobacterium sp. SUN052]